MKTRVIILVGVLVLVTVGIHIVLFKPLADRWSQVAEETDQSLPKYKTIITDYDPEGVVATTTDYHRPFCSMVWRDNLFATQFHPEKSQSDGLRILKNFANLA